MSFDIELDRTFPQPLEMIWRSLTEREALGAWLMNTDFVPVAGHEFQMWCDDGAGGTHRYVCKVLELEPRRRMLWSWVLDGKQDEGETIVEFVLETASHGTRLRIRHTGDPDAIERFKDGWPVKLEQLAKCLALAAAAEQRNGSFS
jgi:uncharacterized protein YndB with AHSA1/START domain